MFSGRSTSSPTINATILHLLGIDHERLSFRFQGLDVRLTGVEPARIVEEIVA